MEWALLWFVFGFLAMIVASAKNRSGCGWFILGCLVGPFALIVAALPTVIEPVNESERDRLMRKCPFCAEFIQRQAVKCRYCASEVPALPPPKTWAEQLAYDTAKAFKRGKDGGNTGL